MAAKKTAWFTRTLGARSHMEQPRTRRPNQATYGNTKLSAARALFPALNGRPPRYTVVPFELRWKGGRNLFTGVMNGDGSAYDCNLDVKVQFNSSLGMVSV